MSRSYQGAVKNTMTGRLEFLACSTLSVKSSGVSINLAPDFEAAANAVLRGGRAVRDVEVRT